MESGKKRDVGLKDFAEDLGEAIELAEGIAAEGYTVYDGNLSGASPEMRRVQRLRAFKKEFVDVPKGETESRNDIKQYLLWHEMQSATYNKFADVFDTLEISPGEYSRRGILRICDVCLESKGLDTGDTGKVQALKEMLEAKENGGEVDEFAAERIAELNYEMVVGFGTKRERELRKNQVEGILRMEAELKELKFKISTFEQKESQMVDILASLYTNMKKADSKQEGMAEYVPEIRHALMKLEPDYREREKYMNALFRALKGEGEIGAWLGKKAKEKLDWELRITERESAEQARYSRKGGGVAKGIGIATLPIVGAAILAGGLWLGQNGITLPFGKGAVDVQKDAAAEVEKETVEEDTEVRLPAGVAEGDAHLDEDIKQDGEKIGVNNDSDVGSEKEEPVEEIQEEPAEESDSVEYERTPEGLEKALDNWCSQREAALKEIQEEAKARGEDRSPFVQTEMIREAYRAIEPQLDGSVNPYDLGDWEKMLLKMKYPNIAVELAIMTDLWSTQIPSEARYAAGIRLSLLLGKRAGRPGKYDFSQAADSARNNGIPLPKIDADTLLGDIEGTGSAVGRCTSASLMRGVLSGMQGYKQEAIDESKASEKAFMKKVTKLLGRGSSRLIKAWENAVEEGKHEARKDVCKTATKDRIGRDGAKSAEKKDGFWKKLSKKRSRKRKEAREEADSITGGMNKGAYEKHGITPPSQKPKGNPNNKKKDGSKESLPDLLKRVHERNTGASKLEKTGKHTGLSYRGGVGAGGNKSTEALRREKSEEYLERFRFRGGVDEKKSFPLKRLASKIGIRKGFERTTAQA